MKKKINLLIIILFLLFLLTFCKSSDCVANEKQSNWNNGYCELDGGRLIFDSVGSKYHYKCEICGKDYTFDKVMSYK